MKQTLATLALVSVILAPLSIIVVGSNLKGEQVPESQVESRQSSDDSLESSSDILYWGTTCPHCHDTIAWIDSNRVDEKFPIIRKEVYNSAANALDLTQKARSCGLDENNVGVPFMYTSEKACLIGTPEITEYLAEKASQDASSMNQASASATTQEGGLE